ncbi:hypothetical protein D0Z00_002129 [Geotrichum galactomycetum]|uniref:Uncharacterized protein n=1 Tax=Geotrichum galactomycetum TaxID=27317 RepID=A0ACB6V4Z7_9ASCO|nr:hypothetical protein D0Z00_002129 [Geotrichum candidum]
MKLKPSILEEITTSHFGAPPPPPKKYTDGENDEVFLEDESGRVKLVGDLITGSNSKKKMVLVTGCVVAVMGSELASGDFNVLDIRFIEYAPQAPLPSPEADGKPRYLALVSGLGLKGSSYEGYPLQLLKEYLTGELGGSEDQTESAHIVQLIVAGNSLNANDEEETAQVSSSISTAFLPSAAQLSEAGHHNKKKKAVETKYGYDSSQFHPEPMHHLDSFLAEVVSSVPVTIMPGDTDLANITMPQQPIHHSLFPECNKLLNTESECPAFETVTNPHWMTLASGMTVLGTAGQPINDMYKYLPETEIDRLDLLNQTLRWQHVAPTAPDTLAAYSFYEKDPFILTQTPHIYFAGNQPYFDARLVEGTGGKGGLVQVRLVAIPKFSETGELVLIDLNSPTLETTTIKFA